MVQQIEVLVKHKESDTERTITYRAYLDASSYYELIGQVDEKGNLIPGNPNLRPQHQTEIPAKESVAGHADEEVTNQESVGDEFPVEQEKPERKKPGPKKKSETKPEQA